MPTFPNKYNDLIALSKTSKNWAQAINPSLTEQGRLDGCEAFMNEVAWSFNGNAPEGMYGKLWRYVKKYSDDCIALKDSDGTLYENDLITSGGAVDAKLKWGTPVLSKWAWHPPTNPYGGTPEPPQPPDGGDEDMPYRPLPQDVWDAGYVELEDLNIDHWNEAKPHDWPVHLASPKESCKAYMSCFDNGCQDALSKEISKGNVPPGGGAESQAWFAQYVTPVGIHYMRWQIQQDHKNPPVPWAPDEIVDNPNPR